MKRSWLRLTPGLAAALAMTWAARASAAPQIGYAYPAGGQRGTTVIIEVGGQWLRGVDTIRLSGTGVSGTVLEYVPPLNNEDMRKADSFLRDLVRRRWCARTMDAAAKEADEPPLPDHPRLRDLDARSPAELARLRTCLFDPRKQPNAQIAEQVLIAVTIATDAPAGDRELRLAAPEGVSNPLCFQVGDLPEIRESDFAGGSVGAGVNVPALFNGQITPGETDRIGLRLQRGQRLVVRLQARRLIPYLADAVPGWFQATLAIVSPAGKEVAWNDDYGFDPDPLLLYEVPADGLYCLEVRDALYRGRDDFVYRIAVGELPWVTQVFPLGGQEGTLVTASIKGWNLAAETLRLDTRPGDDTMRTAGVGEEHGLGSEVRYAVDALPEVTESEPNDSAAAAQDVAFPQVINGRIERPGDVDVFRFNGQAGQALVAEVAARRLNSPLDSVLRLLDANGDPVAFNDDYKDPQMGLITHQADSSIRVELPRAGAYCVSLADVQHQGGEAYAYRLHLRPVRPDFALRLTPSCINVRAGQTALFTVHALRRDGFDGDIDVALVDAPEGFALIGTRLPAGKDTMELKLSAPRGASRQVFPIRLEGKAEIAGATVRRRVVAADDLMQAFLWRFLVPRQEVLVAVAGSRPVPSVWLPLVPGVRGIDSTPVHIPLGGTARVEIETPPTLADPGRLPLAAVRFRLANHPRGVTLQEATVGRSRAALTLKADLNAALVGDAANVIVEAYAEPTAEVGSRVSFGVLPAIAYDIVRP